MGQAHPNTAHYTPPHFEQVDTSFSMTEPRFDVTLYGLQARTKGGASIPFLTYMKRQRR
jgi:hypothetical protein